jgi:rubrerythrin
VAAERKEKEDMMDDVTGSGSDERATGTPNTIYDLSSVLFHALEGGASYDTYIEDAEREGDEELAEFFRRVRDEDSMRADEAQRLLAERTPTAAIEDTTSPTMGGAAAGASSRTEPPGVPPDTTEELPSTRAEAPPEEEISSRTEPSSAREGMEETPARASGIEERSLSRTEGTPPLEPETPSDLPGTEPIREENVLTDRAEEVPPPPEEVPPERAGEIPTAEEVPPPRTEEVPRAEEIPSGTPPQAPPGDVQRETSPEPPSRAEEAPPDRGRAEEREEKGLLDRAMDALRGREEEPRREESERREPRRDEPPTGR